MTERTGVLDRRDKVHMCVVYAGDNQPAPEVYDLCVRADACFDFGVGANPHEAPLFDGYGLGPGLFRIDRVESPISECEVARRIC